jgi:NAD(P)-dependent dehydrogenase (short-subunit alcohol dehydrogenase family)
MKLQDRVCIITGGGHGLGRDFALAFVREGAHVAVCGTNEEALASTAAEVRATGSRVLSMPTDVSDEEAVGRFVNATLAEFGQIDVLVNNAGIAGPTANVTQVTREEWDRTLAINVTGAFLCARAVLPHMAERKRGKIINIASVAAHIGYALRAPYAVSKWGMIGLSQTLAVEWGSSNIQVNTVSPGPVRGDRLERVIQRRAEHMNVSVEEMKRQYTAPLALGRFAEAEHVTAAVVYLASSDSDSVTGETIRVSSGYGLA